MRRFLQLFALPVLASAFLKKSTFKNNKRKYSVTTKVSVDGNVVGEGDGLNNAVNTCVSSTDSKFSEVEVCGCEVKVSAHLMTRCSEYATYSEEIGTCDCSKEGCVKKKLVHGRENHEMKAMSYQIIPC
ncbi:unnamed protein product [Amoebophrya sp. A120]|nr:unnamed protein product [Amoebophrya sp. A120]|eukprot:GSA120T00012010001.1